MKLPQTIVFFITIMVVFSCTQPQSSPEEATKDSNDNPKIQEATQLIEDFIDDQKIAGLSVTIAKNGENIWSKGFGYADLEAMIPVEAAKTKFRIGSISKSLTASALAQLYAEGKINLDAEIHQYVPSFSQKKYPVTTRQLAGHLAGIRHYRGDEFLSAKKYESVIEGLSIFQDDPLLFEPGTNYQYSSYGWNLISAVIEKASGKNFLEVMDEYVFDKIGMKDTAPDHIEKIISNRTQYYGLDAHKNVINAPYVDNSYKWAGGGFIATTEDVVKFALAHKKGGILSDEILTEFISSQKTSDGKETGYGMGWSSRKDKFDRNHYGHNGGSVGGTSIMRIYPDENIVIVMAANMSDIGYADIPDKIINIFLGDH